MHANTNNKGPPPPPTTTTTITNTTNTDNNNITRILAKKGERSEKVHKGPVSSNVRVNMEAAANPNLCGGGGQHLVLSKQAKAAFKMPVTNGWGVAGSTQVKIQTSHTVRLLLCLLVIFVLTGLVLNYRIHSLEARNSALESRLTNLESLLKTLNLNETSTLPQQKTQNVPILDLQANPQTGVETQDPSLEAVMKELTDEERALLLSEFEDDEEDEVHLPLEIKERLKRAISDSDTMMSIPSLNASAYTTFKNAPANPTQSGPQGATLGYGKSNRKRDRGTNNRTKRNGTRSSQNENSRKSQNPQNPMVFSAEMKPQKTKDEARIDKLKLKLELARIRAKIASDLAKARSPNSAPSVSQFRPLSDPRAAYLTVRDPNIKIDRSERPWIIAESGTDIGFNDLWYQKLALDDNGTKVIFQESGLYLIYAQVYYKYFIKHGEKPPSMGYRIYLKKHDKDDGSAKKFRRGISIAECIPSSGSVSQTCFTQICWFVEEGDEIYLEHYKPSFPMITAENPGQTFLGIVRLSA